LGVDWLPLGSDFYFTLGLLSYGAAYVVTTIGLVERYRRGSPVQRAQIRWFAAAIIVSFGLLLSTFISSEVTALNEITWTMWILSLMLPPLAIAIAVLRYRLYDIDRIISNTLSYGLVTVTLFGVFAVVNFTLQEAAARLLLGTGVLELQGVAVAGSTLLVAVLFQPLRARVQRAVDRRFHRANYDAERTVEAFATQLRGDVDLADLRGNVLTAVHRSMEPAAADLWLRGHSRP
jgi:hypothetical protein